MSHKRYKVCFFSREGIDHINKQQYSLQDINILKEYGFEVVIISDFLKIPWDCDLYFSWWASGSFFPLIVARIRFKPIFVIAGGNEVIGHVDSLYGFKGGYADSNFFKKLAVYFSLKLSSKLFVVSSHMVKHVERISSRTPIVLYNSVDTNRFFPKKISKEFISSVINFDEISFLNKRGFLLLEAFALIVNKYPNISLQIIGKYSPYLNNIKNRAFSLGIQNRVCFVCDIPNLELPDFLNKAKLYVQLSDTETFGMALVEAMALEIPVVCSVKGAFLEVAGDLGIFCDNNDVDSIKQGLCIGLDLNEFQYNERGSLLRARVLEKFDFNIRKDYFFKEFDILFNKRTMKEKLKNVLPKPILDLYRKIRVLFLRLEFYQLSSEQAMNKIYFEKRWGKDNNFVYYSGRGSHDDFIIKPYVDSVKNFLIDKDFSVLDLGCGDFNVGSRISPFAKKYIACDIVTELIDYNKIRFKDFQNTVFFKNSICEDDWPVADVVCIRQVLQHLSNNEILKIIPKLSSFKYAIITESLPLSKFEANIDNFTGPDIRLSKKSGVVLDLPPFNFSYKKKVILCQINDFKDDAIIQTLLYQIN
jgi:glycosyltransferase involved in cell wall biosynthesis